MFIVFGIMLLGVIAGYFLRRAERITFIGKLITGFIFLLLFFLGVAVGQNKIIIENMSTIGLWALVITLAAMLGSVLMACVIYKKFFVSVDNKQS